MSTTRYLESGLRDKVFKRDNHTCRYCGDKSGPFHVDHVYPFSKGGETSFDNLVTACKNCNHSKLDSVGIWPKPVGYFEKKNNRVFEALFLALIGVLLLINGPIMINREVVLLGRVAFISGIAISLLSLAYLLSMKWE